MYTKLDLDLLEWETAERIVMERAKRLEDGHYDGLENKIDEEI